MNNEINKYTFRFKSNTSEERGSPGWRVRAIVERREETKVNRKGKGGKVRIGKERWDTAEKSSRENG